MGRGVVWVRKEARKQHLEMVLGLLGFFTFVSFLAAVVAEVQGKPAVTEALVLAAFLAATYVAYRAWRKAGR
jgi:hypothetical protein